MSLHASATTPLSPPPALAWRKRALRGRMLLCLAVGLCMLLAARWVWLDAQLDRARAADAELIVLVAQQWALAQGAADAAGDALSAEPAAPARAAAARQSLAQKLPVNVARVQALMQQAAALQRPASAPASQALAAWLAAQQQLALRAQQLAQADAPWRELQTDAHAAAASSQQLLHVLKERAYDTTAPGTGAASPAVMLALAGLGLLVLGFGDTTVHEETPAAAAAAPASAATTPLCDHDAWRQRLVRTLEHTARHPGYGFALLALKLDVPQPALHTLGDGAEQALAHAVQRRLQDALRPCDSACQHGGNALHHLVLLDGSASAEQLQALVQTVHAELCEPYTVNDHPVRLRASLGVVPAAAAARDVGTLLLDAELALTQSSAQLDGTPAPVFYSAALRETCHTRELAAQGFAQALQAGQFELHLQPVLALASGQLAGVRAELCWRHEQRGVLQAEDFYAEAEDAGCAAVLDAWQLQQAAQLMAAWSPPGHAPAWVSLALAPGAVTRHAQAVARLVQEGQLQASRLELRLAEQELASDAMAEPALRSLRGLGVRVALHGLSHPSASLSTLSRLPVAAVVIDGHFVHQAASVEAHAMLARAIVSLAASLGLDTVADAIDDGAQHALMQEMGVMLGHGPQLGAAMPAAHFARWLGARA